MAADPASNPPRSLWRELLPPLLALAILAALAHAGAARWEGWRQQLAALGPWAPVAYLALWGLLVPCGFPAAALGLAAGFVFGARAGCAWAAAGLGLSGLLMYGLGRRWLGPRFERAARGRPRFTRFLAQAATGGVRLHVLARLSPLNYALMSYTLAAGGAPWRPYLLGLAGGLPGLVVYVWLGAAAAAGRGGPAAARQAVIAAGALALLLLAVWLGRRLEREGGGTPPDGPGPAAGGDGEPR